MALEFSKQFQKRLHKLPPATQEQFWKRLELFLEDTRHPLLHDHQLHGEYAACRSINITGDVRAIYTVNAGTIFFLLIGTHSELYE